MRLVAELHLHTVASGHGYSTINEYVRAAKKKGIKMIAITDHGPALPGGPHLSYFGYLYILPKIEEDVQILVGVEANILDTKGSLDLPERYLERLDIVLAGFHPPCYEDRGVVENTKAMINVIKNPLVDIIVHPGNPAFPIDIKDVVAAAKEYGCLLEINNTSLSGGARKGSRSNCFAIAKALAEEKMLLAAGSDAHYVDRMGCFDDVIKLFKETGISEEQVLNTSTDKVMGYLKSRGKLRRFQQ
ncbi:MAG: phosphatase [Clostridia bacterium]|nr:phosphatase [Clostridia bacterium]